MKNIRELNIIESYSILISVKRYKGGTIRLKLERFILSILNTLQAFVQPFSCWSIDDIIAMVNVINCAIVKINKNSWLPLASKLL